MLLDPAKPPQPDEPLGDLVPKSANLIPGLVSVAVTVVMAILVHRIKKNSENSLDAPKSLPSEAKLPIKTHKNLPPDSRQAREKTTIQLSHLPSSILPIDIKRDKLRDYGGLALAIASLLLSLVIAYFAYGINKNQLEAMQEDVNVKFVDEFKKNLADLTLPELTEDSTESDYREENRKINQENRRKKFLASVALAHHGERALPALKMSLMAEDHTIRKGAAVVVLRMLAEKKLRATVHSRLLEYFDESNPFLRLGVLECFVMLYNDLSVEEFNEASGKFRQHVLPGANYSGMPHHENVLLEAVNFFANWPSRDSTMFLLAVAKNTTCVSDTREQASNYLPPAVKKARDLSNDERNALRASVIRELEILVPEASERLGGIIKDRIDELRKQ